MTTRRTLLLGPLACASTALLGPGLLAGCAGTPAPPIRWYALRDDLPADAAMPAPATNAATPVWEVLPITDLPGELDRETLVVAAGSAGLQPLPGHRWAEPLRDSVPRLLLHDLQRLRGADRAWPAPAPAGVAVARRLRVELRMLLADADRRRVRLRAQWWLLDTAADPAPPQPGSADIQVPVAGGDEDALAAAHRAALWQLAMRIAATR